MKRTAAVGAFQRRNLIQTVDLCGNIVKASCPKEKTIPGAARAALQHQRAVQLRVRSGGRGAEIPRAALGIETPCRRDGLQQRGFARAVFSHQKRDRFFQPQAPHTGQRPNSRQGKGIIRLHRGGNPHGAKIESIVHGRSPFRTGARKRGAFSSAPPRRYFSAQAWSTGCIVG